MDHKEPSYDHSEAYAQLTQFDVDDGDPLLLDDSKRKMTEAEIVDDSKKEKIPESKFAVIWQKYPFVRLIPSIMLILVIWFIPPPEGLTHTSMHLFAVFLGIILSFLTQPYPMSVTVLLGLVFLSLTKSFECRTKDGLSITCNLCGTHDENGNLYKCSGFSDSFKVSLHGYSDTTVWLVFAAFQIGAAVQSTGLGKRISLLLVKYMGVSLVGLGYAVCMSEMLLGPVVPSNTARGSLVMAIVTSICRTLDSFPNKNARSNGGEYLILVGGHANLIAASMYQTGMAANPIISGKAEEILGVKWEFAQWLWGSWVPAITAFCVLPWTIKFLASSEVDVSKVRARVKDQLIALGPLNRKEWTLVGVLLTCLCLWVSSTWTGLDATQIAVAAVVLLLMTDTLNWNDVLKNEDAWDTTIWLGGLIVMADQLTELGISKWIGDSIASVLEEMNPIGATLLLGVIYFFSMYIFCSLTGHIVAFIGPFLDAGKAINAPPFLLLAVLSYFSTLCGSLTNYSTGPIVIYFSQKYVSTKKWFAVGLIVSLIHVGIWYSVGMGWWKILGWY